MLFTIHIYVVYWWRVRYHNHCWIAMDLLKSYFQCLTPYNLKSRLKPADYVPMHQLLAWRRHRLWAYETRLACSALNRTPRHGRSVSLGSPVLDRWWTPEQAIKDQAQQTTCQLVNVGSITINRDWVPEGTWIYVQAVELGTAPADRGATPGMCWRICFDAVLQAYQKPGSTL